jgi:hypothetical protein
MVLPSSKATGIGLLILGTLALGCMAIPSAIRILGFVLGIYSLTLGFCHLGRTGQMARALQPLVNRLVGVEAWGLQLAPGDDTPFQVDSVSSLGVGLWIHMHQLPDGPRLKLKIAQPTALKMGNGIFEVPFAGYLQWASKKVKSPNGKRAPGIVIFSLI